MENTKQTDAPTDAFSMVLRSRAAFLRELPELLTNPKYDSWCVAYHGDERIGIAETEIELSRECKLRGLRETECYIGCIFPHADDEEEEIEIGFYELEGMDEPDPNGSAQTP